MKASTEKGKTALRFGNLCRVGGRGSKRKGRREEGMSIVEKGGGMGVKG